MANVKGAAWIGVREYLVKTHGPDALDRVRQMLLPADQEVFTKPILTGTWFDYGAYIRFLLAADKVLGKGDRTLVREAAAYHARYDFNSVYRIYIGLESPDVVIRNAGKLWERYFDRGVASVTDRTDKGGRLKIVDFPDMPPNHEVAQLPFIEEALRLSSCAGVVARHAKCLARGDDCCLYEVSWR